MGWTGSSASDTYTNSSSQENGTKTPIISPQYSSAFNSYLKSMGLDPAAYSGAGGSTPGFTPPAVPNFTGSTPASPSMTSFANPSGTPGPNFTGMTTPGATPLQNAAIDYTTNSLVNSPVDAATKFTNSLLGGQGRQYGALQGQIQGIIGGATPQSTASTSDGTFMIDPKTGASMASPYLSLADSSLIDPSLAAYDYGTDRNFSALDARTAGAGAFGNERSGLGYSDLGAQSALGRAQLAAGLRTTALQTAINAGQADAGRWLTADTTNAGNLLNNNEFNANLLTQNSQNNAALQQNKNAQDLQATQQIASTIAAQSGLSQQLLSNVVTADGIDTEKAQSLFAADQITQDQLTKLLAAASEYNGSAFTDNKTSNSNTASVKVGF